VVLLTLPGVAGEALGYHRDDAETHSLPEVAQHQLRRALLSDVRLLPDDIAGVLALHGKPGRPRLWMSLFQTHGTSRTLTKFVIPTAKVIALPNWRPSKKAADPLQSATGSPAARKVSMGATSRGDRGDLLQALAQAEDAVRTCERRLTCRLTIARSRAGPARGRALAHSVGSTRGLDLSDSFT
jgi:hypothetical protein